MDKTKFGVYGVSNYFDDLEYDSMLIAVYESEDEANIAAAALVPADGYVGYEVKAVQS